MDDGQMLITKATCAGLYTKHVPIVPVLVESWSGQVIDKGFFSERLKQKAEEESFI